MSNQESLVASGQRTSSRSYKPRPVLLEKGEGMWVEDQSGARYLDFLAGIAVNALGYSHPDLVAAVQDQASKLLHVSNIFFTEPQVRLQERLCELSFGGWVYPCNSGAEANEAAIKLARRYQQRVKNTPRFEVITFDKSFHGRTYAAISATAQPKYHDGFEPMVPGFVWATYNDLQSVRDRIGAHTAAILIEPIQGEGGIRPADKAFLEGLRSLCDEHGLLLIFDEVQCGVGRTGDWFAYQHFGVEPDIMTLAKGLGGGVPVGAMVASSALADGFQRGSHASTFGGNPLASRAALTVLEVIERDGLLENARRVGEYFRAKAQALCETTDGVIEVRGVGLMNGIVVDTDVMDPMAIYNAGFAEGLLFNVAGGTVLRFVPPLIATESDVDEAFVRLERAIASASSDT